MQRVSGRVEGLLRNAGHFPVRPHPGCARSMIAGLTRPELSEFDPPVAGEGSIDPMGLATISEDLADLLFPGLTNRMNRVGSQ